MSTLMDSSRFSNLLSGHINKLCYPQKRLTSKDFIPHAASLDQAPIVEYFRLHTRRCMTVSLVPSVGVTLSVLGHRLVGFTLPTS